MQANHAEEPVDMRARRRLKELRMQRGLTLRQVAERANIDISTLSRLEAGKRRLALDHLPGLAAALGVTADELLRASPHPDPRIRSTPRTHDGMTMWPLTQRSPGGSLHAFKIDVSGKRRTPPAKLAVHDGYEWVYVLSGTLRLRLGDQDFTIGPGEAVEFSTWTPHWVGAADGPVEVLAIFGPQGERIHFH